MPFFQLPTFAQILFYFVVFQQSGKLQLFDLAAGTLLETVDAHQGAVWSVCIAPDKVLNSHSYTICAVRGV